MLIWFPTCSELGITKVTMFSLTGIFNDINFGFFIFYWGLSSRGSRNRMQGGSTKGKFVHRTVCIIRDWCSRVRPTPEFSIYSSSRGSRNRMQGAPPRVNLYTGQFASSETDVAGFAQLKKEASISEITFYCQLVSTQSRVMITANASQWEWLKHWNKTHIRVLERNNNMFIWSQ